MTGFELAQFIAIMLALLGIMWHQQRSNWYQQQSIDQLRSDMNAGFAEARADRQAIRNEINQRLAEARRETTQGFSDAQAALDKARTESRDGLDTLHSDTNKSFQQVWAELYKIVQRLVRIESRLKIEPPPEDSTPPPATTPPTP